MFLVRLADRICKIDLEMLGGIFSSWNWKLDPYKVFDIDESEADLTIQMRGRADYDRSASCYAVKDMVYHEMQGLYELYAEKHPTGELLWSFKRRKQQETILEYLVSPDWRTITILKDCSHTDGSLAFEYLRYIVQGYLVTQDTLTFHGVLLEIDGKGIIMSADSGVGKTTRARVLRDEKRAIIINGDRAVIKKKDGVWTGYGLPWSGSSGEYMNREVPICAMVLIERAEETLVEKESGISAFAQVLHFAQAPVWDRELADHTIDLVEHFVSEVSVIKLCSQPTISALNELLSEIIEQENS